MTRGLRRRLKLLALTLQRSQAGERKEPEPAAEAREEDSVEQQPPIRVDAATPDPAATVLLRLRT